MQARDGNLFDYFYEKPEPIAPQSLTREIPERSDYRGQRARPARPRRGARDAARELKARGRRFGRSLLPVLVHEPGARGRDPRAIVPEEMPGVTVSLSSEVLPRIREWPRLSTTLLNAYLEPVMVHYIDHLNQGLDRIGVDTQQRFLMQSNGGVMPFSAAIAGGRTVHTLFSGPAAGAQASAYLAKRGECRPRHARHGRHELRHRLHRGRHAARNHRGHHRAAPGRRPGARHDDDLGRRRLDRLRSTAAASSRSGRRAPAPTRARPATAAAASEPTVTDADVVCGLLNPNYFLGGKQTARRGRLPCGTRNAHRPPAEAQRARRRRRHPPHRRHAHGRRGAGVRRQARRRSCVLHAAAVRRRRRGPCRGGRGRARHAAHSGAGAAGRVLGARASLHRRGARLHPLRPAAARRRRPPNTPSARSSELEGKARDELAAEGMDAAEARFSRELDLRYTGQGYELRTPLDGLFTGHLDAASLTAARERFDERHAQIHGHAARERPVELVSYRVRVRVPVPKYEAREEAPPVTPRPVCGRDQGSPHHPSRWQHVGRGHALRA